MELKKSEHGLNIHVWRHFVFLACGTAGAAVVWFLLMWVLESTSFLGPVDRQLRYLIGKLTAVLVGNGTSMWMLWVYEVITNGNIIGQALRTPQSAALFALGILGVSGLIFIYV